MKEEKIKQAIKLLEEIDKDFENSLCLRLEEAMEEFSYYGIASMLKEHLDALEKTPHFHCPINGWECCPYYVHEKIFEGATKPEYCICSLPNPMEHCDDFYSAWGDCDPEDYTDYIEKDSD